MKSTRGYTLIECITYIAVFIMVSSAGFTSFYRCQLSSANLRRDADDIVRALHAGERWRADIRAAIAMPRLTPGGVIIPQRDGEIAYEINDGTVWRQAAHNRTLVLKQVKNSTMQPDARGPVQAWRWELELATLNKAVRMRPLFTFEAAEGQRL